MKELKGNLGEYKWNKWRWNWGQRRQSGLYCQAAAHESKWQDVKMPYLCVCLNENEVSLELKSRCWRGRPYLHVSKTGLHRGEHKAATSSLLRMLFCLFKRRWATVMVGKTQRAKYWASWCYKKRICLDKCLNPATAPLPFLLTPPFSAVKHRFAPSFLSVHCSQRTSASIPSKY